MILKGNQCANGRELALHLLNVEDNEHAVVHELRGFMSDDLIGAFKETEAVSLGTKCQQYLFSLSLNPPKSANVPIAEFERVIGEIERRMGLSGQPRAIVFHEKKGRRHAHCVWSRINVDQMRAINLSHFKLRLRDISRELYLEHDWEMPAGFQKSKDRDPLNFSAEEAGQAKRVKRDPADLKKLFKSCWETSDSKSAFGNSLLEHGFCLARGDRRGFVAVDADGEVYSLSRWLDIKTKALKAQLGDFSDLPDVEYAVSLLNSRTPNPNIAEQRKLKEHKVKVAHLVTQQRQQRIDLSEGHETRRIAELKLRQDRLPTGLKAVWARLNGQYQRLCKQLAEDAKTCSHRDQREQQAQIDRHLAERRELDRERAFIDAQHAFEQEIRDHAQRDMPPKYQSDPNQPLILPRDVVPFTREQLIKRPSLILSHLSEKNSTFTRNDILRGLAEFIPDPALLRGAANKALADPELVSLSIKGKDAFATQAFQSVERALQTRVKELAQSGGFSVNNHNIEAAINRQNTDLRKRVGANLSIEQISAIQHILSPSQFCAVVGLAGTGKSTLLATARVAWERQGCRVHGAALAGKAADSLQSASGIPSRTLASFEASWKNGYEPIDCGDVVVIDEAGMVGSRQLARVTEQLQQRGCKLVLIGDPDQLQPIEAGAPFRDIVESVGASHLTEIRRQQSGWQRQASRDLAGGFIETALQSYADHGLVHNASDRDQAIAQLVDDYVADWKQDGNTTSCLALAHRRIDVHAINQAIRAARKTAGVSVEETLFKTDHGPRAFTAGDRILFTRNDATLGVRNGMLGTVNNIGDAKLTIQIDTDEENMGRKLTIRPNQFASFDHGFAVSIHRAQGCTIDKSYVLSSRSMDESLTYVAMTRHMQKANFYTAPDIAPKQLQRERNIAVHVDSQSSAPTRRR